LPEENILLAASAVPVSMTVSRTGALIVTSRLAMDDISLAASPSIEPAATVRVTGCV
jgi:hypothetical protein